jgi:hypothetical protein
LENRRNKMHRFLSVVSVLAMAFFMAIIVSCAPTEEAPAKPKVMLPEESSLNAYASLARNHIDELTKITELLAVTSEVKSLEWEKIAPLFKKYEGDDAHFMLYLVHKDGS